MTLSQRALAMLDDRNPVGEMIFGPTDGYGRRPGMPGDPYNGASRFDRDVLMWNPINQSADMEILPNKVVSDARAKDAVRNDAFIQNANNTHKDSVVGSLYMLNCKPNRVALGLQDEQHDDWETAFQEEVEGLWNLHAENNNAYLDAARSLPFTGQVRLAVGIFAVGGEVLASAEWNKDKSRPFKTCVNFIDTDRLRTPFGQIEGPNMRRGVSRDDYGAATAFTICDGYPNDPFGGVNGQQFNYTTIPRTTPWGREQMIYLKDAWRPDQTRGVATMVSALKEWKMTKGFRDVTLQNAITNATFAASIESEFPQQAFDALAGSAPGGGAGSVVADYAGAFLGAIDQYTGNKGTALMLDGVRIPHLFPGTKLKLTPAGTPGGVGTQFEDALLRYLAAALGLSYEQLSKNYSNTNYSSIRATMIETWKYMQSRKRLIADRFANSIFRLWFEEMYNAGMLTTLVGKPSIYLNKMTMLDAYCQCEWIGASRGQIDELKETQAALLRSSSNFTNLEYECGKLGLDWRQVLKQKARELAMMKKLGIDPASLAGDIADATTAADQPTDDAATSTQNTKNSANGTPNGGGK